MIKAIIFDYYKVLATKGNLDILRKKYGSRLKKEADIKKIISEHDLGKSSKWLYQEIGKIHNISPEELENTVKNQPAIEKNKKLIDFIKNDLREKYKIGLLSNMGPGAGKEILDENDWALFDDKVHSFEVGLIKPDPAIYYLAAQRLGVEPTECVFVDDKDENVLAAKKVGMKSIVYQNFNQFYDDLETIFAAEGKRAARAKTALFARRDEKKPLVLSHKRSAQDA